MINVAHFAKSLEGKPVAVFGIGKSNLAVIKALVKADVKVVAGDDRDVQAAIDAGAEWGLLDSDFSQYACLVLAPGVPYSHPEPHDVVKKALAAGIEIICDIEILHRLNHGRQTIGITGTNGKSTTTALIGHILKTCNVEAEVGGNIGHAVLDLDMPPHEGAFVIEISSYQIDLCPNFTPDIAVHLNLTPDHLDRHGSVEGYYQSKRNMFWGSGSAIIGVDDEYSRRMAEEVDMTGARQLFRISVLGPVTNGVYEQDGALYDSMFGEAEKIVDLNMAALMGPHNHQNAAAAYAATRMMGLPSSKIIEAMQSFPGLQHRQFPVRKINDIIYINDSKATNAAAAEKALACYDDIFWILGGKAKDGGLDGLEPYMNHITHAFTIGDAMEEFSVWLEKNKIPVTRSQTLSQAVPAAHNAAQQKGRGVVLLSPACASFDQFKNFEQRGDEFVSLVHDLKEKAA